MREVWGTIAQTSGAGVYGLVTGVVVLFLTARWLGPEGRGVVAAVTTWVTLFAALGSLSLGQVALHYLAGERGQDRLGAVLGCLLVFAGLITIAAWAITYAIAVPAEQGAFRNIPKTALVVGFLSLPFLVWEQYGSALLMTLERLRVYNRYQVIGRTTGLAILVLLVAGLGAGIVGVLIAMLVGQVIVASGGLGYLVSEAHRRGQKIAPRRPELLALISGGTKLHLNAVGTILFTSAGILILNHYRGPSETAFYQLAVQLMGALMIVPQSVSMVIYGRIAALGPDRAWPIHRRLAIHAMSWMVLVCMLAGLTAPAWLIALAGEQFQPAVAIFQWMLFGVVGMTFSAIMAPQWIGRGYFLQASALTLLVGLGSTAACLILIPKLGIPGAVYAFLGTCVASVVANGAMAFHCDRRARANKTAS